MSLFSSYQTRTITQTYIKVVPELHHYQMGSPPNQKRVHLRVEADGSGVLLINASQIVQLNPSATLMARLLLDKVDDDNAIGVIQEVYHIYRKRAKRDYLDFKETLLRLVSPYEVSCPICDLNLDTFQPFSQKPSAPYRMDLALTYRCNNHCAHCYNQSSRNSNELTKEDWHRILDRVWALGIPHVVFTGGEPTLVKDLPDFIAHAEELGLITGLNTNGRRLADHAFVKNLVAAGLEHVQITIESHDPTIHDYIVGFHGAHQQTVSGIRNVLETNLYMMTNTTLLRSNSAFLGETLVYLSDLGVPTIGLNGLIQSGRGAGYAEGLSDDQLPDLLRLAIERTNVSGQRLIWYTPTQYCYFNPLESGLGVKGCTAALYNMCVEPNGVVLPCQSYYQPLGHLLRDEWENIWNHKLAQAIRAREYVPADCRDCDLLATCGGGCPLSITCSKSAQPKPLQALQF